MFSFLKSKIAPPLSMAEKGLVHRPHDMGTFEMRDVERAFTRLFLSEDGQKVLSYLQSITFQRALGPGSDDQQLRYMEGQRALLATILRLINRGRGV